MIAVMSSGKMSQKLVIEAPLPCAMTLWSLFLSMSWGSCSIVDDRLKFLLMFSLFFLVDDHHDGFV